MNESARRIGFRFLFSYLVLFFFPFPSGLVNPWWLGSLFDGLWGRLVPWFGRVFLGVTVAPSNNGSGDTAFDYVRVVLMLVLAAVITVVWSVLDRRRPNYRTLQAWSRIWLRYALAVAVLTYGAVKVLMVQFEPPGYGRLIQPLGQLSPMALLWTFMGFSPLYTCFTGAIEVLGGILLFFRRTTTLGALIVAGAMAQVFVLNLAYDVPVKLGSLHILLLALVVLAPDMGRLWDFFVRNRPTPSADPGPALPAAWQPWALGVKAIVVVGFLAYLSYDAFTSYNAHIAARDHDPTPPEGWYQVVSLTVDGRALPPLDADQFRWRTITVRNGRVGVRSLDGSAQRFRVQGDPFTSEAILFPFDSGPRAAALRAAGAAAFTLGDSGSATVRGTLHGHRFEATTRRENPQDFPLMSRGFRWISDAPYFR